MCLLPSLPIGLDVKNLAGAGQGTVASETSGSGLHTYVSTFIDPAISWKDVEWLRGLTSCRPDQACAADDARRAVDAGVSGIVVSNHGGH
jgi:isopentenyl diphosphate isomerase/L-lactate dehydrogenase-like FMN-dependent dehydrogenase